MKNYRKYLLPVTGIALSLLLSSCSGEGGKAVVEDGTGPGERRVLAVKIIPDEPTVNDELMAMVSGDAGDATFRWEVDGVRAGDGDRLDASVFSKGQEVTVTVNSEAGTSVAKVGIVNAPPVIESLEFTPAVLSRGTDVTAHVVGHDPDDDFISYEYQWFIDGKELYTERGPVLNGELYGKGGLITLKIIPSDGEASGAAFISKPVYIKNAPPRFTSVPPDSFKARVYSYKAEAVDPDGDALTYTLVKGPQGMTMDSMGLITWPIGPGDNGTHSVEIAVEDGFGIKDTQSYEINVELIEK